MKMNTLNTFTRGLIAATALLQALHADCFIGASPARFATNGTTNQQSIDAVEASFGREAKVLRVYAHFGSHTGPQYRMAFATSNNMNLYYRLTPDNASNGVNRAYRDIKNGVYDSILLDHCNSVIDWIVENNNKWVLFSFSDEMNGNWKSYRVTDYGTPNAPGEFKSAWRHIHQLFGDRLEQRGLSRQKIKFCFSPSRITTNGGNPNYRKIENIFPGDAYVHFSACNLYNNQESWVNHFPINQIVTAYGNAGSARPLGFGEIGCERNTESGHTPRAPWLTKHFSESNFSKLDVRYFNYFDTDLAESNEYNALGDADSDAAMQQNLSDPFFIGG